jgi:hypothetical protein
MVSSDPLYEVFEKEVEDMGNGQGTFIWPRKQRFDGVPFGFNSQILAKKKAQYLDKSQFRAQYYNNPNDPDNAPMDRKDFQYYEKNFLSRVDGHWWYKSSRLNIFASIDFAYSLAKRADWTCIAVVGVDHNNHYYVLDIARFKTKKISEYFDRLLEMHIKWGFKKIRAEVTAAQDVIVKDLKDNYIRVHGLALSVDDHRPTRHMGTKAERVGNTLEPRYQNGQIWHYKGGNCEVLEDELVLERPPHDDVKDALACAIDICVPPSRMAGTVRKQRVDRANRFHPRFGGATG